MNSAHNIVQFFKCKFVYPTIYVFVSQLFVSLFLTKILYVIKSKGMKFCGACSTNGGEEGCIQGFGGET